MRLYGLCGVIWVLKQHRLIIEQSAGLEHASGIDLAQANKTVDN